LGGGGEGQALLVFQGGLLRWQKPNVLDRAVAFYFNGIQRCCIRLVACFKQLI